MKIDQFFPGNGLEWRLRRNYLLMETSEGLMAIAQNQEATEYPWGWGLKMVWTDEEGITPLSDLGHPVEGDCLWWKSEAPEGGMAAGIGGGLKDGSVLE